MVREAAVLGAGVMGHGIAQLYATAGAAVRLHDVSAEALASGLRAVEGSLALLVEEGVLEAGQASRIRARIRPAADLDLALRGAEVVTECIPEVLSWKRELLHRVERVVAGDALVFSNTSTLPVARLGEGALHPGRMAVTHFFNPAQLVPLVEVVPHPAMGAERVERTLAILRDIGKVPVLLRRDVPGFIANRLQAALVREAFHLLELGVAGPEEIDAVVTAGPGVRWPFLGPIETADLGGLEVWRRVMDNLAPVLGDAGEAPAALRERVERGDLGAKTGRGIFDYPGGRAEEIVRRRDRLLVRLARLKEGLPGSPPGPAPNEGVDTDGRDP
ncbi:MAG TPA: 3-hydroxyacyl-CoA dehydrogenase family protein [Anaeromyxobacteraceae bacterium]|nr:3-hydroxyacyl-CoA dehydrogenase family protein [Anaeromyxobacteraceae bacterium]